MIEKSTPAGVDFFTDKDNREKGIDTLCGVLYRFELTDFNITATCGSVHLPPKGDVHTAPAPYQNSP